MLIAALNLDGFVQFITVLLIFIFVLVITYLTTRFVGGYQQKMLTNSNIKVIETMRISNNKYMQIVNVADKYFVIAVSKDNVTYIGEVNGDNLTIKETVTGTDSFKSILDKMKIKNNKEDDSE